MDEMADVGFAEAMGTNHGREKFGASSVTDATSAVARDAGGLSLSPRGKSARNSVLFNIRNGQSVNAQRTLWTRADAAGDGVQPTAGNLLFKIRSVRRGQMSL
jgi:hypothetical protein